jgi:peptidoglycan hydrolase-like protein with peptidoglycan-binding domain
MNDRALLVAMPLRHLDAADASEGPTVTLPAGGPGDLDDTPPGTPVLVIATEAGDAEVPAATWSATFQGRVRYEPGSPWPPDVPPTWVEEHPAPEPPTADVVHPDEDEDEDDDEEDDEAVGPQSFFRISGLARVPRSDWVFANELVPKQERGGRTFVPRAPRLIARPD